MQAKDILFEYRGRQVLVALYRVRSRGGKTGWSAAPLVFESESEVWRLHRVSEARPFPSQGEAIANAVYMARWWIHERL